MSEYSSDDFHELDLSEFTAEDFAHIDANIASFSRTGSYGNQGAAETPSEKKIPSTSYQYGVAPPDDENKNIYGANQVCADASFHPDTFDLNLSSLTAEELATLDKQTSKEIIRSNGGPSIAIEIEGAVEESETSKRLVANIKSGPATEKPQWLLNSPLDEFRSYMTLSVTDLASPAWCEVQYDYGLRGKRSRPINQRPKSFLSSTGKKISPEISVVKNNDIQTRQGLAIHKELEREIKYEELQVEITTDETRWALRLVNMLACLKSIMGGFTREMPVFGVIHGEVVVGIMDEVVKEEASSSHNEHHSSSSKRPLDQSRSCSSVKRPRNSSPSPQTRIDAFFEIPQNQSQKQQTQINQEHEAVMHKMPEYILHIKDNKTRKNPYLPFEADMQSGRMQLMLYRRLLSKLISTNPPYDFSPIWRKVGVDSTAVFPTKFLVQAHLIEDSSGFQSTCLDDLVALWQREITQLNIIGVDSTLELVYRLRPSPGSTRKGKGVATQKQSETTTNEERDLAIAIAASLEDLAASENNATPSGVLPSFAPALLTEPQSVKRGQLESDSSIQDVEDIGLQWALRESVTPQNLPNNKVASLSASEHVDDTSTSANSRGKDKEASIEEQGIRRFKIIGTKKFLHDDKELDKYLDHVLQWWRGERKPEGVPPNRTYRCSYCEYENDCEWRAEKALELTQKKGRSFNSNNG